MNQYSTREAAQMLGLDWRTIQNYIAQGKIVAPPVQKIGGGKFRAWTDRDIERLRKLLPKIKNGRKTRHQKKQLAASNWQLAKAEPKSKTKKKPQPGAPSPRHAQKRRKSGAPKAVPHVSRGNKQQRKK